MNSGGLLDFLKKKIDENIEKDMLSTYEGSVFWEKYKLNRATFNKLQIEILSVIKESGITVQEAIGFMQYMKYPIIRSASFKTKKADE